MTISGDDFSDWSDPPQLLEEEGSAIRDTARASTSLRVAVRGVCSWIEFDSEMMSSVLMSSVNVSSKTTTLSLVGLAALLHGSEYSYTQDKIDARQ